MDKTLTRDSNAELLRIISIFIILLHHFCVHALYPEVLRLDIQGKSWDSHFLLFIHAFLYIGVNCFILISGFYGIKTKWHSLLTLYLIYAFYNLMHPIIRIIPPLLHGEGFVLPYPLKDIIMRTLFPFSHGHLWFMDCYLALFFVAPLLNVAITALHRKQHLYILCLLTFLHTYCGNFWHLSFNPNGYTLANFVYLYMIGAYIHKYLTSDYIDNYRWRWLCLYIISGLLWGICSMMKAYKGVFPIHIPHWYTFSYNNILLLLTTVFFFLFILSFHFKSKAINWVAASTLGVYMLNEMVFGYKWIKLYAHRFSPLENLVLWFSVSAGFFVFAIAIDKCRELLTKPIWWCYNRYIDPIRKRIYDNISNHF